MAPAVRADMGDQEQDVGVVEQNLISLAFNEPLSWKPGKPIATHVLLDRLERLSAELNEMDQDTTDQESLNEIAPALAHRNLLSHKDRGVKAYATSCAVDLLRICAPNAPFEHSDLKLIFTTIINHVLPALQDSSSTYNQQHLYVLGSLADVQSVLLINDVKDADELTTRLFQTCFDCLSGAKTPLQEDAVHNMTVVMSDIIRESPGLPSTVVESIMAQFMRAAPPGGRTGGDHDDNQATLLPKSEPVPYTIAKKICNHNSGKMARYIGQYFSEFVLDASNFAISSNGHRDGDGEDETAGNPSENDLKSLGQIHLLIRELWRSTPDVLQAVVPQVDAELNADNPHLRLIATEAIGDMIAGIGAAGPPAPPDMSPARYPPIRLIDERADSQSSNSNNSLTKPQSQHSFAQTHPSTYAGFLSRRNDKTVAIRAAWTLAAGYILSTSAGGIGLNREEETDLVKALAEKLHDGDEKVRLTAVKALELLSFRDVVEKLGAQGGVETSGSVLAHLADRCRDKRSAPRVTAMALLGRLWAAASGELADENPEVTSCLAGAASGILNVFYTNDPELNVLLDRVIFECLLPISFPPPRQKGAKAGTSTPVDADQIRAKRILLLVKCLDLPAKKVFFTLQSRQPQFASVLETYIQQCEAYNGGAMKSSEQNQITARLDKMINYWCLLLPDQAKVKSDLLKFARVHDRRCYQLIRFAISPENDYLTVSRAIKELFKRIKGASNGSLATIMDTMIPIIYRSAILVFNRSHLPTIMDYSRSNYGEAGMGSAAHEIIKEISQHNSDLFKTYSGQLLKEISEAAPTAKRPNEPHIFDTLKAYSSFARKNPNQATVDRTFAQKLNSFALYGKPPKTAKHAVTILMASQDEESMVNATNLIEKVMQQWSIDAPGILNSLATVSQLELLAPSVTLEYDGLIRNLVVQQILQQTRTSADNKPSADWVDDESMSDELAAKLIALKLLVNRIRAIEDEHEAKDKVKAVVNLLRKVIAPPGGGELSKTGNTPQADKARLRLLAAQLLLKLCTLKYLDEELSPSDFNQLAYVVQDVVPQVRVGFVDKLQKYLGRGKLRPRFYTIPYLMAFEPKADLKLRVETWLRSTVHSLEQNPKPIMQGVMGRLLSLLAHHPDFRREEVDLLDHARYIMFYLNIVAVEDNLGLIYKYAERIKQTRDAIDPGKSENVYVMCDLAQAVIRAWQTRRNWSFQAYPGKVGLPVGLYLPLGSHDDAQNIAQAQYLPSGVEDKLDDALRAFDKKKRRSMDERAEPPAKKAKKDGILKSGRPKKAAKSKSAGSKPKKLASATTSKRKEAASSPSMAERRRSGRSIKQPHYIEADSGDEDEDEIYNSEEGDEDEEEEGDQDQDQDHEEKQPDEEGNDNEDDDDDDEEEEEEEAEKEEKGKEAGQNGKNGENGKNGHHVNGRRTEIADSSSELEELSDVDQPMSDAETNQPRRRAGSKDLPPARVKAKVLPTRSARATRGRPKKVVDSADEMDEDD